MSTVKTFKQILDLVRSYYTHKAESFQSSAEKCLETFISKASWDTTFSLQYAADHTKNLRLANRYKQRLDALANCVEADEATYFQGLIDNEAAMVLRDISKMKRCTSTSVFREAETEIEQYLFSESVKNVVELDDICGRLLSKDKRDILVSMSWSL